MSEKVKAQSRWSVIFREGTYVIIHFLRDDVTVLPVTYDISSEGKSDRAGDDGISRARPPATLAPILVNLRQHDVFTGNASGHMVSMPGPRSGGCTWTHKPRGSISSIRSLTLSPISFIHAFTRSRSFGSGQVAVCSVEESSFFMYALSRSVSNLGRGDGAPERGGGGERRPGA